MPATSASISSVPNAPKWPKSSYQEETLNVRLAMNSEEWLRDGRKIPDEVMGYLRKIAVQREFDISMGKLPGV
jgi:hypothetical protein